MVLSVVVVNYKVPHYLQLCLESLHRALSDLESEIIVVDNASGDHSIAMIEQHFPGVICIKNEVNVGFSTANNQGVKAASGTYVCILNPDTFVPEDCFEALLGFANGKSKLGAVGVRLIDGTGHFLPESKRNLATMQVSLQKLLGDGRSYYANQVAEQEVGEVPILVGAFMLMRRQVYEELDGFDEDFFMYGEDIDLSYRLTQLGYSNQYFGTVSVLHFKGESTVKNKEYAKRFYGAMRIFSRKHFYRTRLAESLMGLGLNLIVFLKSFSSIKPSVIKPFNKQYWVGDGIQVPKALVNRFEPLAINAINDLQKKDKQQNRFVFDLNHCTSKSVLKAMQDLKNKQNTFRIRPSNCNFSCGSDSTTAQGDLMKWDD